MSNLLSLRNLPQSNQLIRFVNKIKETAVLPERFKGGRIERLLNYGKNVLGDYRQAVLDTYNDSLQNRRKAFTYLSLIGALTYLYKTNPHPNSFKNELINHQNLMSITGEPIRNAKCYSHLDDLNNLHNQRLLRKINLLFLTVYVRSEFSDQLKIYQANCKYLQPSYLDYLRNRIVDIGIANRWILLNRKLKDFDINPDEWKQLDE